MTFDNPQMQAYLPDAYAEYESVPDQPPVQPPVAPVPAAPPPGTPITTASPGVNVPPHRFPEEDLADLLAKTTYDPSTAGSTLIACPKGTGKSNLIRAGMYKANQLHQGRAEFVAHCLPQGNGQVQPDQGGDV
ncbi:hypothetical protein K9N68_38530 (plasmid) [Kovacikia minuta CCNUW1]|uniref:hypothetical protein n=1 Tax=Kovacikia minuta TaxID=2931930 RepID=UPI001CCAA925|nr:hypothetical protein [Kovacikia minuta]UBF30084.1 hypothetical protein K9N68_38530 [Kovacikia minuta CCNUW1]